LVSTLGSVVTSARAARLGFSFAGQHGGGSALTGAMWHGFRAAGKLYVVPAGALPLPVSETYTGLHRAVNCQIFSG
jgi:hypothetical protein